jgi:undecaprenyl-diphosphatase
MATHAKKPTAIDPLEVPDNAANQRNLSGVLRSWRTLVISLASSVVLLILFASLSEEVFEGEMKTFDTAVRLKVHEYFSPQMTTFMQVMTFFGSIGFLFALFLALTTFWIVAKKYRSAAWLAMAAGGSVILDVSLKLSFHRLRPTPFVGRVPMSYSFPSGHALSSFCFYGVLAGLVCARIRSPILRKLIWSTAALLVLAIGISRIYLGVHYPTDVVAGYVAAATWVSALLLALYSKREVEFWRSNS